MTSLNADLTTRPTSGPPRSRAALGGVLATAAGLGVGHLVAALFAPASSPVVAVGSRAIDITPAPVKDWAVATFGTADKAVLVGGALVVTLALGAVAGVFAQRRFAAGLAAGGVLAVLALVAAWLDPGRPGLWWLPGAVTFLVAGLALRGLTRADAAVTAAPPAQNRKAARSRREWLTLAASMGGVGLVGGLLGESLRAVGGVPGLQPKPKAELPSRSATAFPVGLETEVPGLSPFVTPASTFYRIDTALSVPQLDAATWRLEITGAVDRPFSIGWDELLAMEAVERPVTLACVSNYVGGDLIGSARWLGARTSELLARAGVRAGADMVLSTSSDGFTVSTPLAALTDGREALLAYGMNGDVLPAEHGYPVRLLTPGLYGFVGATKWLVSMEVTTYAAKQAYWTQRGWSDRGPIKPSSRIDTPQNRNRIPTGRVKVGGSAWAHGVGVGGVQVRVDGGPWVAATLGPDAGVEFWRQWVWTWDAMPGVHQLQVRVIDAQGKPQDENNLPPAPDGATGLHTISVDVA